MKNRSDITYEELTLCKFTIQYNCKLFIKSDITYEELTLVCHFVLHNMPPYTLHMSDITYEELTL